MKIGDLYSITLENGKYGAIKILRFEDESVVFGLTEYIGNEIAKPNDLGLNKLLSVNYLPNDDLLVFNKGQTYIYCCCPSLFSPSLFFIGNTKISTKEQNESLVVMSFLGSIECIAKDCYLEWRFANDKFAFLRDLDQTKEIFCLKNKVKDLEYEIKLQDCIKKGCTTDELLFIDLPISMIPKMLGSILTKMELNLLQEVEENQLIGQKEYFGSFPIGSKKLFTYTFSDKHIPANILFFEQNQCGVIEINTVLIFSSEFEIDFSEIEQPGEFLRISKSGFDGQENYVIFEHHHRIESTLAYQELLLMIVNFDRELAKKSAINPETFKYFTGHGIVKY